MDALFKFMDGICDLLERRSQIQREIKKVKKEQEAMKVAKEYGGKYKPKREKKTLQEFYNDRKVERSVKQNQKQLRLLRKLKVL